MTERAKAVELDAHDQLSAYRDLFHRPGDDRVYLAGNSLGMLPLSTRDRLQSFMEAEWGDEQVRGWQHCLCLPMELGDSSGELIGAASGQVVLADSISVNLYKLAASVLEAQPGRKVLLTDLGNFPSDPWGVQGGGARRQR